MPAPLLNRRTAKSKNRQGRQERQGKKKQETSDFIAYSALGGSKKDFAILLRYSSVRWTNVRSIHLFGRVRARVRARGRAGSRGSLILGGRRASWRGRFGRRGRRA